MSYPSKAVANEFLRLANTAAVPLSPMKVQKLVYFAHGWLLGLADQELINEPIEAWKFGPVIRPLYRDLADYGNQPITSLISEYVLNDAGNIVGITPGIDESSSDAKELLGLIRRIWEVYGGFTAIQLSNLTHIEGSPWHRVYIENSGVLPDRFVIPRDYIRDYFANLTSKAKA